MGPRGGRHGLRRFLRPTRWPPAKPFPIATEGLRTGQMRAGLILRGPWAGGSRSAGQLCPGEQLEAAAWKQGVAVQGFSSRRASGPLPQAAECGPAPAPGPPNRASLKGLTGGRANSCRPQAFSGPAPGMRGVAAPGPKQRVTESLFSRPALECSLVAQPTPAPRIGRGHIPGVSRASPRAFSTLPCQPLRARGRGEGSFYDNLTFCYLFSFLWFLQL